MKTDQAPKTAEPDTKTALIIAAIEILGNDGWGSLRMRDLAKAVGIRAPSIYHHYATKTDLGLAMVDFLRCESEGYSTAITESSQSLRQRLDHLLAKLIEDDYENKSCPLYILQAEFAALPETMQVSVRALIERNLNSIAGWISEAQANKEIQSCCESLVQARILWATIEHGIQLQRILPDITLSHLVDCWYRSIANEETPC